MRSMEWAKGLWGHGLFQCTKNQRREQPLYRSFDPKT